MEWNEDYTDRSRISPALTQCEAQPGAYACVRKIVTGLARINTRRASSGPTLLAAPDRLGDILERATGMSLAAWLRTGSMAAGREAHTTACGMLTKVKHDVAPRL